jgi:hypothetical protein
MATFENGNCLIPNLLGRPIVQLEPAGTPSNLNPTASEARLLTVNPLMAVSNDEQCIGALRRDRA